MHWLCVALSRSAQLKSSVQLQMLKRHEEFRDAKPVG